MNGACIRLGIICGILNMNHTKLSFTTIHASFKIHAYSVFKGPNEIPD